MHQTWENGKKKTNFESDFGLFHPNFRDFYLYSMLNIVASYHCMQFQGILLNWTWTMAKYPVSRPILASLAKYGPQSFLSISPLLDVIHCCKLSLYAISRKTNDPNLKIQSWENLVTDRCTDRQTEGPRDEKDFIGCCPTNVKRPKKEKLTQKL